MLQRQITALTTLAIAITLAACGGGGGGGGLSVPPTSPDPAAAALPQSAVRTTRDGAAVQANASDCINSVLQPIYSGCFTGNSPFHHTYAELSARQGFTRLSQTVANNFWAQGIGSTKPAPDGWASGDPIYYSTNANPGYTVECPAYGTCNAATRFTGKRIHIANGDYASADGDHHIAIIDTSSDEEIDMWGGYNTKWNDPGSGTEQCEVGLENGTSNPFGHGGVAGELTCSWGGVFPFSGNGLAMQPGMAGIAAGFALGVFTITSGELMRGSIHHALGLQAACADAKTVYPSDHVGTDYACNGSSSEPEPNVAYGTYIHLKNSYNVATSGYSHYCQVILTAFQQYGAFYYDNNNYPGTSIHFEMDQHGYSNDPWYSTIFPSMKAGDDTGGWGTFSYCLQRLNANDIEMANISTSLP